MLFVYKLALRTFLHYENTSYFFKGTKDLSLVKRRQNKSSFRGKFPPSFGLAKSFRKPPHLSIVSTGFALLTTQFCKDHFIRKYLTILGAIEGKKFYSGFHFPAKNDKIIKALLMLETRFPLSCYILVHERSTIHFDLDILSFPKDFGVGRRAVPNGM